ncbi:IS630 family transposase [Erythrobacter sp. QSSC1-22B]|uniref:IS630 family transposase n=1 Tax=Erythrobacter sp. QSSC1-22B TaxID=1860125 RepID=UPI001F2A12CB|nr:IS630 family transposase [Erythrobacter sp. QSSC1-22B]
MAAAIKVRTDYTSADLRRFSRRCEDADQVRRLLAVAHILDGGSRSEAAKIAGVTLQIVRDWVLRFNEGGPEGLATRKAPGRASILNDEQRARLAEQVEAGPIPAAHGVVRWRLADLAQWVWDEFRLSITRQTLGRELRAMGYRKLSARPRHRGQKPEDIDIFKKKFAARLAQIKRGLRKGTQVELWWQDEARIGQQTKLTRRWARRGTRPSAPKDQRRSSVWIFGAICPAEGKAAGIVMPKCNSQAMSMHLEEIAFHVAPGAHAVVLLDQAGWHGSAELVVPSNITLMPLPPRCPELNPVENVWQFMRDNWLSNRIFGSYEDIVDHCCHAWNKLADQPWRIMTLGLRRWAHGF